jgi:hypothetical protein
MISVRGRQRFAEIFLVNSVGVLADLTLFTDGNRKTKNQINCCDLSAKSRLPDIDQPVIVPKV